MSAKLLERLKSDTFAAETLFFSTPSALRRFLARTDEVAAIRQALRQGGITENAIREFVSVLLRDLRHGERFPHELALAVLAVVFEMRPTAFAEEFLHDLSRLRLAEMSLCIRVARECLRHRVSLPETNSKRFALPTAETSGFSVATSSASCGSSPVGLTEQTRVCEAA